MARPSADDRLRRLLALVPWVVAAEGPTVVEVCARFGMTEAELLADLDLVFLCGVHPFTPDTLMDFELQDGRVWIRYADWFRRPLRLTPEEGLALVTAGATLLAVPGSDPAGPLARALAKIAGVLGVDGSSTLDVDLGPAPSGVLDTLRGAVGRATQVEIDYYAYGRDERTRRVVDPWAVYAADGEWYLQGWCHLAQAERRFRVDRIRGVDPLDTPASRPAPAHPGRLGVFDPAPDDPRVVLVLEARARWVAEQYPVESVEELEAGRCRVTLVASERAWLERLLLRLGPDATVVEGPDDAAASAAARILARYGAR